TLPGTSPGLPASPAGAFPFSVAWHLRRFPHSLSFLARHGGVVSAAPAGTTPPASTTPAMTGPQTARRHHVARVPRLPVLMISCFMTFSCLLVGPRRRAGPIAGDPSVVGVSLLSRSIPSPNLRSHP